MSALSLRVALARGAIVALANWQALLVDFAVESFYKLLLAVPAIGGAVMVAAVVGTDPGSLVAGGIRATVDVVVASLATAPVALLSFLAAIGLVALAGEVLMFALKSGTLAVVLAGGARGTGSRHDVLRHRLLRRRLGLQPRRCTAASDVSGDAPSRWHSVSASPTSSSAVRT